MTTKQISVRVGKTASRVVKLRYAKSFDDRNTKRVERVLDRLAMEFDKLAEMGVEARVSYEK